MPRHKGRSRFHNPSLALAEKHQLMLCPAKVYILSARPVSSTWTTRTAQSSHSFLHYSVDDLFSTVHATLVQPRDKLYAATIHIVS
jgi:hypothetical protein